jgi:hypothetical protein
MIDATSFYSLINRLGPTGWHAVHAAQQCWPMWPHEAVLDLAQRFDGLKSE